MLSTALIWSNDLFPIFWETFEQFTTRYSPWTTDRNPPPTPHPPGHFLRLRFWGSLLYAIAISACLPKKNTGGLRIGGRVKFTPTKYHKTTYTVMQAQTHITCI